MKLLTISALRRNKNRIRIWLCARLNKVDMWPVVFTIMIVTCGVTSVVGGDLADLQVESVTSGEFALSDLIDIPSQPVANGSDADLAMDMCSMDPCPTAQDCANAGSLGYLCRCPVNFVGESCSTECISNKADIAFLLDSSSSLNFDDWKATLYFVSVMILQLQIKEGVHRIAVITFGDEAVVEFDLNMYSSKEQMFARVRDLPFRQERTNTSGALWKMREQIFRNRTAAVPIGIIITDGASTLDVQLTVPEAQRAKESGIVIFAIGVTDEVASEELESIASLPTSRHLYKINNFRMLSAITNTILERTCELMPHYIKGSAGATGDRGSTGQSGRQGDRGDSGFTGLLGLRGPQGTPGDEGYKGDTGPTGSEGRQGPPGVNGPPGETGATGSTGRPGPKGDNGQTGGDRPGVLGQDGVRGLSGRQGGTGAPGRSGVQGDSGATGDQGLYGPKGSPGATGFIGRQGPRGLTGDPGAKGMTGEIGADGPLGYIYEDGDECSLNVSLCQHLCINKRRGYECRCRQGYLLLDNGHNCRDIDECATTNGGCEHLCHNTDGSYVCSCTHGFTLSLDTKTCMDVDECCTNLWPIPCLKSRRCVNTLGGHYCIIEALIRDPYAPPTAVQQVRIDDSPFLKRELIIGLFVWLGALTIVTIICVILAASVHERDPVVRAMETELLREGSRMSHHNGDDQRIFPRLSLASRQVIDNSVRDQEEIHVAVPTNPSVPSERPTARLGVPRSDL